MGQKVNPIGIRLGYIRKSSARWFPSSGTSFAETLKSDIEIRAYIEKYLPQSTLISRVEIMRTGRMVKLTLHTAKPGVVIGKKGEDIERLRQEMSARLGLTVNINIAEIRKPDLDPKLVAENIAQQLLKRIMFRRAMKRAIQSVMRSGAKGVKIQISGRLGGAEIARSEGYREGRVPLHTFRADIDYGTAIAKTTAGIIGIKVWIFKGEVLVKKQEPTEGESA